MPPEAQSVPDYCSNLEEYIHADEMDGLVQLAIIHAQFEIIHPFWDGNGRTGRIIIALYEAKKGEIVQIPSPKNAIKVLDFLFSFPVFDSKKFVHELQIANKDTCFRILRFLSDKEIVVNDAKKRGKTYFFHELINIIS